MPTVTLRLKRHELAALIKTVDRMRYIERRVHRINEEECNQELTARAIKAREALEVEYSNLAESLGLKSFIQRDPRGSALRVGEEGDDESTAFTL